jgi:phosphoribosyl 1,2-cyclic phosphodiesterase
LARYISLYSGSSGNCSLVESDGKFIIIDMGKSARMTKKAICDVGLDLSGLLGIFVSHEHTDHVSGLNVFLKKTKVPLFTNPYSLEYLRDNCLIPGDSEAYTMGLESITIGPFKVNGFFVPHDSEGCMGYRVSTGSSTMAIATDIGCVTSETYGHLTGADLVVLESNYDDKMLREGPYPYSLKYRIGSNNGHLSNIECANTILRLMGDGAKKFRLCHLSRTNNTPVIALTQIHKAASSQGIELPKNLDIKVNRRLEPTEFTRF